MICWAPCIGTDGVQDIRKLLTDTERGRGVLRKENQPGRKDDDLEGRRERSKKRGSNEV